MSDWFLNNMIICAKCSNLLWFSPEGHMLCKCPDFSLNKVSAKDIEKTFINDLTEKLFNDDIFIGRITQAANAALGQTGSLNQKQVAQSLLNQYEKIFNSANYLNKRKLTLTLVKSIKIHPDLTLEIEYNDI